MEITFSSNDAPLLLMSIVTATKNAQYKTKNVVTITKNEKAAVSSLKLPSGYDTWA
jgi:hypothetical protein